MAFEQTLKDVKKVAFKNMPLNNMVFLEANHLEFKYSQDSIKYVFNICL